MLRYPVNVDGHFLTKAVDELFHKQELITVPFMTGVNDDEGGWLLPSVSGLFSHVQTSYLFVNVLNSPCFFTQFLVASNWTEGMDREDVVDSLSMFFPDVRLFIVVAFSLSFYRQRGFFPSAQTHYYQRSDTGGIHWNWRGSFEKQRWVHRGARRFALYHSSHQGCKSS